MHVLIAVSSKHGATREIGQSIADVLVEDGFNVDLRDTEDAENVAGYDAVIVGSAIYLGKWRSDGVRFLKKESSTLASMPVWLFSSGPVGTVPGDQPLDLEQNMTLSHARSHCLFAGRLKADGLGPVERVIIRAVHAESGDFRDWDAIHAWASAIATSLKSGAFRKSAA